MNHSTRIVLTASAIALGTALALQPLSSRSPRSKSVPHQPSPRAGKAMVTAVETAAATGGHGGGNGGGRRRRRRRRWSRRWRAAAAAVTRPIGAAPRPTAADGVMATGHRRMRAAVIRAPRAAARGEPMGILEGFLSDIRGDRKAGRSSGSVSRAAGEKSKAATADKGTKSREAKNAAVESDDRSDDDPDDHHGNRLEAAGQVQCGSRVGDCPHECGPHSTVGKIAAYERALKVRSRTLSPIWTRPPKPSPASRARN